MSATGIAIHSLESEGLIKYIRFGRVGSQPELSKHAHTALLERFHQPTTNALASIISRHVKTSHPPGIVTDTIGISIQTAHAHDAFVLNSDQNTFTVLLKAVGLVPPLLLQPFDHVLPLAAGFLRQRKQFVRMFQSLQREGHGSFPGILQRGS